MIKGKLTRRFYRFPLMSNWFFALIQKVNTSLLLSRLRSLSIRFIVSFVELRVSLLHENSVLDFVLAVAMTIC